MFHVRVATIGAILTLVLAVPGVAGAEADDVSPLCGTADGIAPASACPGPPSQTTSCEAVIVNTSPPSVQIHEECFFE